MPESKKMNFRYSSFVALAALIIGTPIILLQAMKIRLLAIRDFGLVIHEFDPYFNFRATEYLYEHGREKFFKWFDYMSWYPLGRPVGTTIYPGMQFTAVWIKNHIVGDAMSLNDVCCYIPVLFGVLATILVGCITYESCLEQNTSDDILSVLTKAVTGEKSVIVPKKSTGSLSVPILSAVFGMSIMAVIPAHLMRSVGGGFDNECVAITAMLLTFYFWVRSLRAKDDYSYLFGILSAISYFYMVACWGGYVFVLNMVALHAVTLVLLGRFTTKLYLSYSLFYLIGTILAMQVPVVGLTPIKSLEQLGAGVIFFGFQVLMFCEINIKRKKMTRKNAMIYRVKVCFIAFCLGVGYIVLFTPPGFFGPVSSRVRALFVKHTKTGNPLVDSVAEHQPAKANAYIQYLQSACFIAPIGFIVGLIFFGDSTSFSLIYGLTAYFFSHKMMRLILLMAPVTSILSGIALGRLVAWSIDQFHVSLIGQYKTNESSNIQKDDGSKVSDTTGMKKKSKKKQVGETNELISTENSISSDFMLMKKLIAIIVVVLSFMGMDQLYYKSWRIAVPLSNPSIIQLARDKEGKIIKVDDYREAYNWIRENTPEDSRILAWWDYGYQLTSIANRTTLADGNTWNHEHIALLARILTGHADKAYDIARHLADYILVWSGGGGDDVAKSPHLARIANSVYRGMCEDPVCSRFGFVSDRNAATRVPSKQMKESLVYNLVMNRTPGVIVDGKHFEEVFLSRYGKVRIYKIVDPDLQSKSWVADPMNRRCDVPGSWFCPGQYPPALTPYLQEAKTFVQRESFSNKDKDKEYQQAYFEGLESLRKGKNKNTEL